MERRNDGRLKERIYRAELNRDKGRSPPMRNFVEGVKELVEQGGLSF